MGCLKYEKVRVQKCSQNADKGYSACTETRDDGYNQCTEQKDRGYNRCCDWWPCSWACRAWVWVSNIVCVVWTWVSNVVCVVWTWIKNVVCVAWVWITTAVCIVFDSVLSVGLSVPGVKAVVGGILNFLCGNTKPPNITNSREAKAQLAKQLRDKNGNSPYETLSGFDEWIAWFTTPVFKENGICGWTDYHLVACASGQVEHAALSQDGIYTVDILIIALSGSFTVNGSNGIEKPNYMRAEIFSDVVAATVTLPKVGDQVDICGELFWDGDGFLEIHPRSGADIQIL
jgi:hypothetical protein